jgi:hypothetical protein
VLQRSIEPVPATDGLIHLPYAAQATNTLATPANILGVVPVDPLADFAHRDASVGAPACVKSSQGCRRAHGSGEWFCSEALLPPRHIGTRSSSS